MLLPLIIFSIVAVFALLEHFWPRQAYVAIPFWKLRGVASIVSYLVIATAATTMWDGWLKGHTLFDVGHLPVWQQAGIGLLMAQFLRYWWHRALHGSDFLWRHFHQLHHSPERMDVWGALYFSPQDLMFFTLVASLASVGIFGLSPQAVLIFALITVGFALWTHANIETPYWLGYFIVRPEAHALHHERGVHKSNYCDLPIIDMLFGTFKNPRVPVAEAGLYDGASKEIFKMLRGVDLMKERDAKASKMKPLPAHKKAA